MKALLVVLCLLFAGLTAFTLVGVGSKSPEKQTQAAAPSELAGLREQLGALEKRLDSMQKETHLESSGGARLSQSEIDAAVERALSERGLAAGSGAESKSALAHGVPAKLDGHSAFAELTDPSLSWEDRRKKWSEIAKAGLLDEVLAQFEKLASDNPNDTKAQTALGNAYLNKLFNSPQGPEAGIWGGKADKAFDRALALDDHNWEARYVKAVSLSNWPAFLGKQPEAIANLETLVQQQSQGEVKPYYAQTYLILGNLYKQSGKNDQALAMWQQGAVLFPDNADILKQIQLAQQQH
jgi:tetratricopeptide (TPR) repeat protein